eukprot:scaffold101105_cov72-Attheya_sp.AAC.2
MFPQVDYSTKATQKLKVCRLDYARTRQRHGRISDQDRPGTKREGRSPSCPHNHKKVVVLGSMLGPSALFNTGYRHGANGDGKEPGLYPRYA